MDPANTVPTVPSPARPAGPHGDLDRHLPHPIDDALADVTRAGALDPLGAVLDRLDSLA